MWSVLLYGNLFLEGSSRDVSPNNGSSVRISNTPMPVGLHKQNYSISFDVKSERIHLNISRKSVLMLNHLIKSFRARPANEVIHINDRQFPELARRGLTARSCSVSIWLPNDRGDVEFRRCGDPSFGWAHNYPILFCSLCSGQPNEV
jgi:hypothetical protein